MCPAIQLRGLFYFDSNPNFSVYSSEITGHIVDALGYKIEEDGSTWFSWVFIHPEGATLWLNGILGEVQDQFMQLGAEFTADNFDSKTIPMLQGLGYVFDFNEKCRELAVRIPLTDASQLYDLRFRKVEPTLHAVLQRTGNGFCDNGYVTDGYLTMLTWAYDSEKALQSIRHYLPQVLEGEEAQFSIWLAENGVPQLELWSEKPSESN